MSYHLRRILKSTCYVLAVITCNSAGAQPLAPPQNQGVSKPAVQPNQTDKPQSDQLGNPLRVYETAARQPVQEPPTEQPNPSAPGTPPKVDEPPVDKSKSLTTADIDAMVKSTNEATNLDEQQKKEVLDRLKSAADWLRIALDADVKTKEYESDIANAPTDLSTAKDTVAVSLGEPQFVLPDDSTLPQIEQRGTDAASKLKMAREQLAKREDSLKRRGERRTELGKLISELPQRIEVAKKDLAEAAGKTSPVDVARHAEYKARYIALENQKLLYPVELKRMDARTELAPLLRDIAMREVTFLEKETAGWQKIAADFRKRESDRQAAETRRQAEDAHPALKSRAERNAALAEQRKLIVASIEKIGKEVQQSVQTVKGLKDGYEKLVQKVEKGGHSTTIGFLLRRERDHLPDVTVSRERIRFVREETPKAHLSSLDLQDERDLLADLETEIENVTDQVDGKIPQHDRTYVATMVAELLQTKRDLLDKLLPEHDQYITLLGELELSQSELLEVNDSFVTYIDERVLWIRSSDPIAISDVQDAIGGLKVLTSPASWLELGRSISGHVSRKPLVILPLVFVVLIFVWNRRKLRRHINRICNTDDSEIRYEFLPTFNAILALTLSTAFWPVLMWLIGWQLSTTATIPELGRACGLGLQNAAIAFWGTKFLRHLCRRGGVAVRHFEWDADGLSVFRRHITWLGVFGVPAVFVIATVETFEDGQWSSSLSRIVFLAGCLLLLFFAHCLLRSRSGAIGESCDEDPNTWLCRLRQPMYFLGVGIPLSLTVLATLGYDYTAHRLAARLQATGCVILSVIVLRALAIRWLQVRRERISHQREIAAAVDSDAAEVSIAAADSPSPVSQPAAVATSDDEGQLGQIADLIDVEQTDSEVRYLLRYAVAALLVAGVFLIWSDVAPAIGVLDEVQLWSRYVDIKETQTDEDGNTIVMTSPKEVRTTLKHAVLSVFILMLGLILARNIPALLDVLVLENLPIDQGQRYAAGMIMRYITTMAAIIFACRELGLTWSSIQWLAAAMSVGLGFGLQEIFANLVSGLIILFERPIRVGDLVTVGGVSGRVTRMQIRATTITDFDRRELIVPNKKFITEDVMNWTLSDEVNRLVVDVGVAYGSDTALARELLVKVAQQHPIVLETPEPSVTFDEFADSSLNFKLRCFLPDLENRLATIHELHVAIDEEFRRANIEIAFPQRDLHIRTGPELRTNDDSQQKAA